jgi:hypothetical protein
MERGPLFKAGDKVMRVGAAVPGHALVPKAKMGGRPIPEFGVVYCVEDSFEGPQWNAVVFVGGGGWLHAPELTPYPIGWPAAAFRKVEEIKLCVAAVNYSKAEPSIFAESGKRCPRCDCVNPPDHIKCDDCAVDFTKTNLNHAKTLASFPLLAWTARATIHPPVREGMRREHLHVRPLWEKPPQIGNDTNLFARSEFFCGQPKTP